jgi:RNA-directed DNA polymerase
LDAVGQARQMCWAYDWVCDLDIKGFFDNLDQDLMKKAVRKHAQERWMELYIERWLKAPAQDEKGRLLQRERGTPQGGVISPLLANLFLHYAFDVWMGRNWAHLPFERYADDIIVHCRTEREANLVRVNSGTVEAVWVGTASGEDESGLLQGCQSARESLEREV